MANRPITKSKLDKINDRILSTSYKKAEIAFNEARFEDYLEIVSNQDVLKLSVKPEGIKNTKTLNMFLRTISNIMQSMTTLGFTTYEIVGYIASEVSKFQNANDRKAIIKFLEDSYTIVHTDYRSSLSNSKLKNVERILFNHFKEDSFGAYTDIGYRLIGINSNVNRDIKTLCISKKENIIQQISQATDQKVTSQQVSALFKSYYDSININKNIKNPTKTSPSFSSIMITNPDVKVGSRNSIELSTFFNSVSNVEFDRSYPYFNAEFIVPNFSKQDTNAIIRAASINQFINGTLLDNSTTLNYKSLEGKNVVRGQTGDKKVIKTNMSLFTTPQTLVNLDEDIGHSSNMLAKTKRLRVSSVKDSTQPFMSLKNLSLNVAPTKGLMSFKSGKLSLVLHDRSRLPDIAPFVKHDLFGTFGAEIILEYGWSHLDEDHPEKNPLGSFIGNSKVKEVYMITNSSFSLDQNGSVNIDLSIAMKGASLFKGTEINFASQNRVKENVLKSILATIASCRKNLNIDSTESIHERFGQSNILDPTSAINPGVVREINNFRLSYQFLKDSGIMTSFSVEQLEKKDSQKNRYTLGLSDNNVVLDNKELFFKLIMGDRLKDITNKDELTFECEYKKSEVVLFINQIIMSYQELYGLTQTILDQDAQEEEQEAAILETIVGGIDFIDPFYPIDNSFYNELEEPASYVTFGSVISSLIQTHIVNKTPSDFDEVQTIFYTANRFAAGMRNQNLASILIPKQELKEFIKKEIRKEISDNSRVSRGVTVVTIESLIAQIINKFIKTKNNIMYGLSDLYKRDDNERVVPKNEMDLHDQKLRSKLHFIYDYKGDISSGNDYTFKVPSIRFSFDCMSSSEKLSSSNVKSILRISIYDQNDSPFDSISSILDKYYLNDFKTKASAIARIRSKYQSLGSKLLYEEKIKKEFQALIDKDFIKSKGNTFIFNPLKKIEGHKNIPSIKSFYKKLFPSLTFGTQNTAMLSANVSTINEGKLATVYITRSDRNNQSEINTRVKPDLPLRVMPTQASVETFGCPWINFGQFIFLDFDTGTTIDNKYLVNGITHNFSPGKFTTSLTLTYGDVYGQFETSADFIDAIAPEINSKKEIEKNKLKQIDTTTFTDGIFIDGLNFQNSKYYESRLTFDDEVSYKNKIKYLNPLLLDQEVANSLFLFDNEYVKLSSNNSNKIGKNLFDAGFSIIGTLNNMITADKEQNLEIIIRDNNKEDFLFNTVNASPIVRSIGNFQTRRLIVSQKSSMTSVVIKNPTLIFGKKNILDLNKIVVNDIENIKKGFKKYLESKEKSLRQDNNINTENLISLQLEAFNNNNKVYFDVMDHLEKAFKDQDSNLLTLSVKRLTLKDFAEGSTNKIINNKIHINFKNYLISDKLNAADDLVRVVQGNKTEGTFKGKQYSFDLLDSKFQGNINLLQEYSNQENKSLQVNIRKLKKIFNKSQASKVSLYQNFNIFKSFKVSFNSNINIKIDKTDITNSSSNSGLIQQVGKRFFNITLNEKILREVYSNTPITKIKIINNNTTNTSILFFINDFDTTKTIGDFIEYNSDKSNNINVLQPEFSIMSIFDPNYINHERQGTIKSLHGIHGKEYRSKDNSLEDDQGTLETNNVIVYEIIAEEIYDHMINSANYFLNNDSSIFKLYNHSNDKVLGNDILNENQPSVKNNIKSLIPEDALKQNLNNFNNNMQNNSSFLGNTFSWANTSPAEDLYQNSSENIVKVTENVYRGIKKKNLPNISNNLGYLKIMEPWNPPSIQTSDLQSSEDSFNVGQPFDFSKIQNDLKKAHKTIEEAKKVYSNSFPLETLKSFGTSVDFKTVLNNNSQNKNKDYKDVKISDLAIQKSTPDSVIIPEVGCTIKYISNIINNSSTVEKTTQRRVKIQPALFFILYYAAEITLKTFPNSFEEVIINSGGDIPLYLTPQRNKSLTIRHDSGYGADIYLNKNDKKLKLTNNNNPGSKNYETKDKVNKIIWFFLRTCEELGATGIGADYDYDNGEHFHVDIAKHNPDFDTDIYSRQIEIIYRKGGKKQKKTISEKTMRKKLRDTKNVRYWGKDNNTGDFGTHAAPEVLKQIFKDN